MKKIMIFLAFMVLGTVGLAAQDRIQTKQQLKDGSCIVTLVDGTTYIITADEIQTRIQLQLKDGSCLDVDLTQVINDNGDRDRLQLRDDSCLITDSFIQQILNAIAIPKG